MPILTQVSCDRCRAPKKESNDWYSFTIHEQAVTIAPLRTTAEGQPCIERGSVQQFFCGRHCLMEALARWMDHLSFSRLQPEELERLVRAAVQSHRIEAVSEARTADEATKRSLKVSQRT